MKKEKEQKQTGWTELEAGTERLLNENKSFWYQLGVTTGGPLYLALCCWLEKYLQDEKKNICLLTPQSYNLYRILGSRGYKVGYLDPDELKKQYEEGLLSESTWVFDPNLEADHQAALELPFLYFGILNTEKARKQVHGKRYETCAFDFYKHFSLQAVISGARDVFELFFSSPLSSESGIVDKVYRGVDQEELLRGVDDYITLALPLVKNGQHDAAPYLALEPLNRLITDPTAEEAKMISNVTLEADGNTEKLALAGKAETSSPAAQEPEYHLEDEQSIRNYHRVMDYYANHREGHEELACSPLFSVVIPVYNTATSQLKEAIDSVLAQTYSNFELILVDDHSSWENVKPVLQSYEKSEKVRVVYRSENGHISEATNDGLKIANGDYIVFMDCDDIIVPDALYEVAKKLNENPELDFIYSDEDKITEDGKILHMPFFKPDWSPDLFMSMMYTNHLGVYRASIVKEIGGLRSAYNGSQDYDMTLRFLEHTDNTRVGHISKVLYHWRERKESVGYSMKAKNYALASAKKTKEAMLERRGINGYPEFNPDTQQYCVVYKPCEEALVSIIIPSKDHPEILKQCITSIRKFTDYDHYEIIVVDNGSNEENRKATEAYLSKNGAKYLYGQYAFNFSKMCNLGAGKANGSYLLFLNDDIELFQKDWLRRMLGQAQQKHTGAVGAKLFYPETTIIQHAGVAEIREGPSHNFLTLNDQEIHYFGLNRNVYNCIAVTGACLLVSKETFDRIQGFDESFPVAYNDVDFCMKIHELGLYNVQRNDVAAYHHESLSRGNDLLSNEKLLRLYRERFRLFNKHPSLQGNDPFLNRNLHMYYASLDPTIRFDDAEEMADQDGMKERGVCRIDSIVRNDRVRIVGWSDAGNGPDREEEERYLVIRDPYGRMIKAKARKMMRRDLVTAFGRDDLLWGGFECVLDPSVFRNDVVQYRIGILTCSRGNNTIAWSEQLTDLCWQPDQPLLYNERTDISAYIRQPGDKDNLRYYLDQIALREDGFLISGWAFFEEDQHFLYRKELVLVDENGTAYTFQTSKNKRLDVSNAFPGMHFLLDAGFCCLICGELLPPGHTYDVILRMTNCLNPQMIYDYPMEQKIYHYRDTGEKSLITDGSSSEEQLSLLTRRAEGNDRFIAEMIQRMAQKDAEINELARQTRLLQDEYERISNSSFWKITRPARAILDKVKNARRRFLS